MTLAILRLSWLALTVFVNSNCLITARTRDRPAMIADCDLDAIAIYSCPITQTEVEKFAFSDRCSASTTLSDQRQLFLPKNDIYTFTVISFQRHLRLFPMKRLEAQGGARSRRLVHRGRLRLTAPGQARGHCCGPAPADNWVC